MSITSKYVLSADGTRLFAQAAGNPANPAIVCAHGFGGTSFAFRKQLANPRLLDHVYVIAYDLRGNGRSDMPEEPAAYAGKKMAEDFQAVSTAFGVTRPILLGWSLGALLLLDILNALPPAYLRGAILTGGAIVTRDLHNAYIQPFLAATLGPLLGPDTAAASKAALEFVDGIVARPQEVSYEDRVRALGELALMPPRTRVVFEAATRERDTSTFSERVKAVPILAIQGTEDKMADGHKLKEVLDGLFGGQDYEWVWAERAGHAPFLEEPGVHDEAVVKFVKRLTSV